jgi:hypothetical protein
MKKAPAKKTAPKPEQTLKLSEVRNSFCRILATAHLQSHAEYLCVIDGKRTRVIA